MVTKHSVFNVDNSNTDRPVKLTVDNNKSLSRVNSVERRPRNYAFPSVITDRLQNPKNITTGHLNVNILRNNREAVKKLV